MKDKIFYISGPITGVENGNKELFSSAESYLRSLGCRMVFNPARRDAANYTHITDPDEFWRFMMKYGIQELLDSDAVLLLPFWYQSKGAKLELEIAKALGKQIFYFQYGMMVIPTKYELDINEYNNKAKRRGEFHSDK